MTADGSEFKGELVELRQQAHFWHAQHARAVKREGALKKQVRELKDVARSQEVLITELITDNEGLRARVAWLEQQVFGSKSERTNPPARDGDDADQEAGPCPEARPEQARKRGKQPGTKGHGRTQHPELPWEEILHELAQDQRRCPKCGAPYEPLSGTEDSDEYHWEMCLVRRRHRRRRYRRSCGCEGLPRIVTAPVPPKLIPKGKFSVGFWVRLLMEKFLFHRPLYRARKMLALEGLDVSQGTLTGGLKQIAALLQPLYARILERSRAANHWHMDETRWMVFADVEGKVGHRWWLWVVVTHETCVYLLDPSRSAQVPKNHLGEDAEGIVSSDRYSAYKALGGKIHNAFCWSHVRRDFIRVRDGHPRLGAWAQAWVARIDELFRLNAKRRQVRSQPEAFALADRAVRDALAAVAEVRDRELTEADLHKVQRKALESLRNHWDGLTLFADHPEIPMDNNEAERALRTPVVGRKNYYGSGSPWSGALAAMVFTIFQTLMANGLNPQRVLLAYFEACARNGGHPPEDIEPFMPWNLSEEQRAAWRQASKPP